MADMSITHPNNLKTSPAGRAFIKGHEALRLKVYTDIAGFKTIGWGHKLLKSQLHLTEITEVQAEEFLDSDLHLIEIYLNGTVRVPLNQNQFDALVSFCFNLGIGALDRSTLLKFVQVGKFIAAASEFLKWNKFKNTKTGLYEVANGLTKRRKEESSMFVRPV